MSENYASRVMSQGRRAVEVDRQASFVTDTLNIRVKRSRGSSVVFNSRKKPDHSHNVV